MYCNFVVQICLHRWIGILPWTVKRNWLQNRQLNSTLFAWLLGLDMFKLQLANVLITSHFTRALLTWSEPEVWDPHASLLQIKLIDCQPFVLFNNFNSTAYNFDILFVYVSLWFVDSILNYWTWLVFSYKLACSWKHLG